MTGCVGGIIGLQLFWNYQNYERTKATFSHDTNESLSRAVGRERAERHGLLVGQVKRWLADTSFIRITCDINPRYNVTVFHINDRYPKFKGSLGESFSLENFKPKLKQITPEAKRFLIEHFAEKTVRADLQKGYIYYYTQRLGDSLTVAFRKSRVRLYRLQAIYQSELAAKGIQTPFRLNPTSPEEAPFLTRSVNTTLRPLTDNQFVRAGFESPDAYFLRTMRWLILSTFGLILVSLICFGYTVKTLLSQHKLVALKDDFINNMTHELNTPLTSIQITAEALKTFDHSPQTQREYLDIITYQTGKLIDLAAQILGANRQLNKSVDKCGVVDLDELVQKAIRELSHRMTGRPVQVSYHPGGVPLRVQGDELSLANVLGNLIDNALKYTLDEVSIRIETTARDRQAEIVVADNGIGIPAEYRKRVFEPFFRVPKGSQHDVKGYGLGLSYVRQVLQRHGGSIRVEANQPAGSVFTLTLPRL